MALPGPPEPPRGAPRKAPSLLEMGALCLDSEIILGFTSHLLRRRGKVAEGGRTREPLPLLEVPPLKRLPPGPDQDPCGGRPAPEGAGASAEQGHSVGGDGWCRHCHTKLAELKRQAWKLVSGSGTALRDPRLSALLLETLPGPRPGPLPPCCPEAERHCDVCTTHLNQLTREALQLLQGPARQEEPDTSRGGPAGMTSARDVPGPVGPAGRTAGRAGPDRRKGPAWPPGPSVQVSVSPAGPGGTLSTVTIQAQQCLEGMWSVSGVNSFLPPTCLAEAAVAAVAVAESVRDGPPSMRPDGLSQAWGLAGTCTTALVTPAPTVVGSAGPSAAASFFIRAAQKLSLASKRKKAPPPPPPAPAARTASAYPTDFSGVLQLWPPPIPPCLLRVAKAKATPCSTGKVRVTLRIWSSKGTQRSAESMSFLKVDPRKKQVTLYDPAAGPPGSAGPRRAATAAVPRLFAFDAVFPQDSEQAEVCSGTVADVLQAVVGGADGCIFSFGHSSLGKSYTMIGKDSSPQSLGVVPCAISWLFRLIHEYKERTGTRFSVRVSAVEVCDRDQSLHDLLADLASGSLQDTQSPGVYLREDPVCGAQLQNQSELRAPTAERAAFYLDAALAARSSSRPGCSEDARRSSHLLFTLHVYQYCMPKCGRGGMSGGRSRLHLIDLGSCEPLAPSRGGEPPGAPLCLSLSALGSVILALVNGAKHVPYREQRLTMLLRESLATTNCHTTMIVHVSDAPARHAETLSTVQLAARIHRLRRKKTKYASSSSGGESSCEEGRVRRPPAPRPCPQRTTALDPARRTPGDPDCSSSSEQSCDTVIYVGPGGAALSDRELTDNEGPPDFVPIIPALGRRRPSEGPRDADCDHFRCSTFAELQERLDFIDGNEGPSVPPASPARAVRKPPELAAPRKATGTLLTACMPLGSPSPDPLGVTPDTSRAGVQGEQRKDSGPWPELSSLASPLSPRREESGPGDPGTTVRTPPTGCPRLPARGRCLDRGLLTTTVTLQQPVELNGEDELVFTVVEELPLGSLAHPRPTSLSSFGSNCSLQALASGSRPVSIISSINDEFDAYTSQAADGPGGHPDTSQAADSPGGCPDEAWAGSGGSHGSSISSWLSEVSVCVADSPGPQPSFRASPDSLAGSGLRGPSSREGSPEQGRSDSPVQVPRGGELGPEASREPRGPPSAQTIHSSLPRKLRTTSATREGGPCLGQSSPEPEGLSQDPWLLRTDEADVVPVALTLAQGPSWPPEAQALPACAQRVVDGCEVASRPVRRPEARIPPLRRGATTLGVTTPVASCGDTLAASPGSLRATSSKKGTSPKGGPLPRPGGMVPPTPPVRKSSLEPKSSPPLAPALAVGLPRAAAAAALRGEEEARPPPRTTSSLKVRTAKAEAGHRPLGPVSFERPEGPSQVSSRVREAPGRPGRAVPRLGTPSASPMPGPCRGNPTKGLGTPKPPVAGGKGRSLVAGGARALSTSVRTPSGPAVSPRAASRMAPNVGAKAGRGTVMGTKQALRAAHSRVHELAAGGAPVHSSPSWGVVDSDSGNDSGVQVGEERPPAGPALPSPYSKVTAPRRPQRYSSGHGSDNSSVLSGELPPAMGRTALFYHSGGSSGYESVMRDSEAPDSMSESGAASPGARSRSLRSPKKRSTGLQRRRLIPAPLPDATALGRKPCLPGQWVDLPPPLAGALKEPFEIKVYEIDDVQRLQRHRAACREDSPEGLASAGVRLRLAERRLQRLREVQARRDRLCEELAETQGRLMVEPGRWLDQFEVDPQLEPESVEYLKALEQATAALEQCVNLCKAHVMMVTCFDVSASASGPGLQEVDV